MADQPQPQEGGWRGGQVSAAHALRVAAALRVPVSCVPRGRWPLRPLPLLSGGCCCRLGQAKDLGPVSTGRRVCSPPRGRTFELCPGLTGDELRAWSRPPGLWQSRVVRQTLLKLSRNTGNASAPQLMAQVGPAPHGAEATTPHPPPPPCALLCLGSAGPLVSLGQHSQVQTLQPRGSESRASDTQQFGGWVLHSAADRGRG